MAKLFPGKVVKPNTTTAKLDLANSLALAIDEEFNKALAEFSGISPPPTEGAADRQLLFLAIARGLLKYLKDRPDSWTAKPVLTGGHQHTVVPDIDMDSP